MPNRLKRLDVIYQHNPIYFITACAENRRKLFANKPIHTAFKAFASFGPSHGAWIGAYVLMPDHLHLRKALRLVIGKKDFLITSSGAKNRIQKSGTMFAKIRFALD